MSGPFVATLLLGILMTSQCPSSTALPRLSTRQLSRTYNRSPVREVGRGRQRTKYTDSLNSYATRKRPANNELIGRTESIEESKAMIAGVCTRPGT
ncbi:hypothetical protein ElyMa_003039200 [Elysia marginata]|uniref:Hedgehog N-terminal signalling domain-containing protein n=1 Tax=Elysia marginata TaxID=1093978 RepID=A0AAV4IHN7_9GAST|nr:hypothetical protein ElyMa_003039200 [Elysia marginata]